MKAMKKKMYVSPETNMKFVELEKGFMNGSIFEEEENTKSLDIENQSLNDNGEFDFSNEKQWK